MLKLTASDTKALTALATYQYLTAQQMQRIGVGKTAKQVRDYTLYHLKHVNPALVKDQDFGVIAGKGRLAKIFYLSEKSLNIVADFMRCSPEEIIFPRYGVRYQNDYFHRSLFIDFHIELRQWIEQDETAELEFFNSYYTKHKGRGSRTCSINQYRFKPSDTLPYNYPLTIEPDGVFRMSRGGKSFLFAVEVHRKSDSKYITQQLDRHITAIEQNILGEAFNQEQPNLVLSIHESESSFKSVQKRLLALPDFQSFLPYFHFALLDNKKREEDEKDYTLKKDFTNWVTADGKPSPLFR